MALKNSKTGSLPVSEIYNFMTEHFPYFKVSSTGRGGEVSLSLSGSRGNKGGDSVYKKGSFLSRLISNQSYTIYLYDHK